MKWLGPTWLAVDLSAIGANLQTVQHFTSAQVCPVIKADAYGHGIKAVSMFLELKGVTGLAVSDVQEAVEIREAGVQTPILVLTPVLPEQASTAIEHNLTVTVSDPRIIIPLAEQALTRQKQLQVHLKINTGLNRIGAAPELAVDCARQILEQKFLQLAGVYTHFAEADSNSAYTKLQLKRLLEVKQAFFDAGLPELIWHAANSSALFTLPESHLDLVRIGTALFGQSRVKLPPDIKLSNTWQLYTRIIQVHCAAKGEPIGYNRTYITKRDSIIGVIPIGYSDGLGLVPNNGGLRRHLHSTIVQLINKPMQVSIDGVSCPIVGKIAMGMSCVDLTDHPHALDLYGAVVSIRARRTAINRRIPKTYFLNGKMVLIHWHERFWQPLSKDGTVYVKEISVKAAQEILKGRNRYGS